MVHFITRIYLVRFPVVLNADYTKKMHHELYLHIIYIVDSPPKKHTHITFIHSTCICTNRFILYCPKTLTSMVDGQYHSVPCAINSWSRLFLEQGDFPKFLHDPEQGFLVLLQVFKVISCLKKNIYIRPSEIMNGVVQIIVHKSKVVNWQISFLCNYH